LLKRSGHTQTDSDVERQRDGQTDKRTQINKDNKHVQDTPRQTDRQTNGQTDSDIERERETQMNKNKIPAPPTLPHPHLMARTGAQAERGRQQRMERSIDSYAQPGRQTGRQTDRLDTLSLFICPADSHRNTSIHAPPSISPSQPSPVCTPRTGRADRQTD